jgi:hypothetical protein
MPNQAKVMITDRPPFKEMISEIARVSSVWSRTGPARGVRFRTKQRRAPLRRAAIVQFYSAAIASGASR